jgi:outer membrane protein assembly factor BamB
VRYRRRVRLAASLVLVVLAAGLTTAPAAEAARARTIRAAVAGFPDWPTYHGDTQRTGVAGQLVPVSTALQQVWNLRLDGAVYASPVVVGGRKLIATENNTVYQVLGNRVVWSHHLGAPVPRSALPCGNIDPLGITGTPAYDARTNTLIVVAELANPIRHVDVGLDPATGAQRWYRNVDLPASVPGISVAAMQQRGALLVSGGRVYIAYGGLAGDCSAYRGSVVGLSLDAPWTAPLWHFTVPTTREAGIWTPPGPVENPDGGLLVAVGNGASGADAPNGPYDYSDSVLRLAFQAIADSFSPTTWRSDNAADLDLGSQAPAIVGRYVFSAGKSDTAYVLDRAHLGGIGGQVSQMSLCRSFGGTVVSGSTVFVPCTDGLRAVRINADGTMTVRWHAASGITGSPVLGGGRLFALDTGAGQLHLLDPASGADRGSVSVRTVTRFATPALYYNAVLVGTTTGVVAFNWS